MLTDSWSPSAAEIQLLFDLFQSTPVQRSDSESPYILDWGHGYGALFRYSPAQTERGPGGVVGLKESPIVAGRSSSNPLQRDPELSRAIKRALRAWRKRTNLLPTPPQLERDRKAPKSRVRDAFSHLAVEIRQRIFENLDLPSALAVRHASLSFAELGFSEQFWKSRFFPGRELGHMFEVKLSRSLAPGYWSSLYELVKPYSVQPWAQNRLRVLGLASFLRDLVRKAEKTQCVGSSEDDFPGAKWGWVTAGSFMAGRFQPDILLLPDEGCRRIPTLLYERGCVMPDPATALFVSTVRFCGHQYVSGIRIQPLGDENSAAILGYQHAENEVMLFDSERHGLVILGFCLAIDGDAIRGMSVIARSGQLSDWAGDHEGLAKRRLVPTSSGTDALEALKGAFDVSVFFFFLLSAFFHTTHLTTLPHPRPLSSCRCR